MTDHAERDLLLDLAYGELSERDARRVEAHVAGCASCRGELERLQGTRRIMSALPELPAPERGERVLVAAAREAADRARPAPLLPRWLAPTLALAATVAIVSVVSLRASREELPATFDAGKPVVAPAPAPAGEPRDEARAYAEAPPPEARAAPAAPPRSAPRPVELQPLQRERAVAKAAPPAPAPKRAVSRDAEAEIADAAPGKAEAGPDEDLAAATAGAGAPAPAGEAREAVGFAAERKAATGAARAQEAPAAAAAAPAVAPPPLVRTYEGCPGESRREVRLDAEGRVRRFAREGAAAGRRVRVELDFDRDGRITAVRARDLETGAPVEPEVLPGLPRSAAQADPDAPPNCGP